VTLSFNDDDLEYCAGLVREGDPDRFAAAMLAPMPQRAYLISVYAFNLEISKLRETVREAMLGEIRLQWWRDAVAECAAGSPRRHQVVHPLAVTLQAAGLPQEVLLEAIDIRSADLDDLPPANETALQRYVEASGGAIGEIALRCLLPAGAGPKDWAAGRAAGRAWAWIGLARGLHPHRILGRRTVPASILKASPELDLAIERAEMSPAVRDWVRWLVDQAKQDLTIVRTSAKDRRARPVLAQARLASIYADRLERGGFDPFQPERNTMGQARRAMALAGVSILGRVV
jgi:phytoene synthase